MNGFGEFLYALRKEKGMTQAELAQQLGVTNKAVSKWETGEAMPETALLLPISRIFGVSVDELLDGKRSGRTPEGSGAESVKDNIFTRGRDGAGENTLLEKIQGAVCAATVFSGIIAYLILGVTVGLWHPYWVIIPACALLSGITGTVFDACNAEKRKDKIARGENPYVGAVCGVIALSCIAAYLLFGAIMNLWHPLWIIPVAGAAACFIIAMLAEIIRRNKK